MSGIAGKVLRVGKWLSISVVVLALALFAWIKWTVAHFDTKTLPARHGQVDTVLYAREGGKRPLLVALGGSEGGNAWANDRWRKQRERFLDQGYAMLAVGYFGTPHSPEHLDRISLDGIHAAILKAAQDPRVDGRCIAVIGGSRGGELALLLASHYPDIRAVVAIVPGSAVFPALTQAMNTPGFSFHDKPLPFVPVPPVHVENVVAPMPLQKTFCGPLDDTTTRWPAFCSRKIAIAASHWASRPMKFVSAVCLLAAK